MAHGIIGHYGLPGSGKSRDIVENDIIQSALEGTRIYTNVPLIMDAIYAYYPKLRRGIIVEKTAEELCQMLVARSKRAENDSGELENAKIVYDEIQKQFPSGYQKRTPQEEENRNALITFLSWSRHDSAEFVWASQNFASVDFELRRKTHMYVQHEDLYHLGFRARWVARNQLPDATTGDPRPGTGAERTFGVNEVIFRCYRSIERGQHKRGGRLTAQIPLKIKVVILLALLVIAYTIYQIVTKGNPLSLKNVSPSTNAITNQTSTKDAQNVPSPTKLDSGSLKSDNILGNCNDLDSYICLSGECDGYAKGTPTCQFADTGSHGARLLAGDVARSQDGPSNALPDVSVP